MGKFKEYYYTTNSGIYLSLKEARKSIKKGTHNFEIDDGLCEECFMMLNYYMMEDKESPESNLSAPC